RRPPNPPLSHPGIHGDSHGLHSGGHLLPRPPSARTRPPTRWLRQHHHPARPLTNPAISHPFQPRTTGASPTNPAPLPAQTGVSLVLDAPPRNRTCDTRML